MISESSHSPKGCLLDYSVTSSHFLYDNPTNLDQILHNQKVFRSNPLIHELYKRGFTIKELNSRLKCGDNQGFMASLCGCGFDLFPLTWHCCNKTCAICSRYRANKIQRKLEEFLKDYVRDPHSMEFLGIITFSPENFDNVEGYLQIRKDFAEFRRLKYVKERIYGGFPIIEVKTKNKDGEYKGWNIHIHFIYFGRFLDNRIRGYCNKCGQNYIKQDRYTKEYYCANKKCNSLDVKVNGNSKIVKLYKKVSKKNVMIDIQRINSIKGAINYLTKYVSANKDDFYCIEHQADYIVYTKGKRMISAVGIFLKKRLILPKYKCNKCGCTKNFFYDNLLVEQILDMKKTVLPPPKEDKLVIEYIKIQ